MCCPSMPSWRRLLFRRTPSTSTVISLPKRSKEEQIVFVDYEGEKYQLTWRVKAIMPQLGMDCTPSDSRFVRIVLSKQEQR